jgi:phage portal protein BeeE
MRFWLASGLGFCLNHIEQAFDKLFGLSGEPDDFTEFDTSALLRSDQKDRVEALVRGVQGGVFSPNDARNLEGLDSVEYGDERAQHRFDLAQKEQPLEAPPLGAERSGSP